MDNITWLNKQFVRALQLDAREDIAEHVLSLETRSAVEAYVRGLLDMSQPRNKKLVVEVLRRWRPPARSVDTTVPENAQIYKKSDETLVYVAGKSKKSRSKTSDIGESSNGSKSDQLSGKDRNSHDQNGEYAGLGFSSLAESLVHGTLTNATPVSAPPQTSPASGSSKKTKFVPLFSAEGESRSVAKLPGRHRCDCLATKHALINNCLRCGRVVCEQEGSGPCIFCGNLVCTNKEQETLNRGSKKSDKLRTSLLNGEAIPRHILSSTSQTVGSSDERLPHAAQQQDEGLKRAIQHKNRLLEFDRNSVKRTQVLDDESDYFSVESRWLSERERRALKQREEELRMRKHQSRSSRKVTLDFAGRQVLETADSVDVYDRDDDIVQAVHFGKGRLDDSGRVTQGNGAAPVWGEGDFTTLCNPTVAAPQFVGDTWGPSKRKKDVDTTSNGTKGGGRGGSRLQDPALQEMSDTGSCLSMHQPWASLLVAGIKRHEGRSWYTAHRGRLWIAATAKTPTPEEIREVEDEHRAYRAGENVSFPSEYPTGCLLGCVDVTDCLEQDDYRQQFPDGESGSPYVFICENPQQLLVKYPIKGKHKIYQLDGRIHQGAKKGLRPS